MAARKRYRRAFVHYVVIGLNLLLVASALSAASLVYYANQQAGAINRVALQGSLTNVSAAQGQRVMNILLVGSDSSANLDPDDPIQQGRQGQRLADVIIIAHVDERTGDLALLSLPRDLWVDIPDLDRSHRINKAFESGGPEMLVDTIEANFQIPIHHYVNVDFAGFQGLVEAVGTVDIYFPTPARDWNVNVEPARSQTGFSMPRSGCQPLGPEESLAYVRSRYYQTLSEDGVWRTDLTSDLGRIRRQQDFLRQLMKRSIEMGGSNPLVLNDLIGAGLDNVIVDDALTPAIMKDLAGSYSAFEPDSLQTYSLPSSAADVGGRSVLLPDSDDATPVLNLFRGQGFESKSTVSVKASVPDESKPSAALDLLTSAGFEAELKTTRQVSFANGVEYVILHGPDGAAAAELVASAMDDNFSIQQVSRLVGRNIEVLSATDFNAAPLVSNEPVTQSASNAATPTTQAPSTEVSQVIQLPGEPTSDVNSAICG